MNLPPVPASSSTICLYAAFLARSLKFSSIPQYLGIIGLLHKEFGLANPLTGNWHLSSRITGIKRVLGHERLQKLPVTPSLLLKIYQALILHTVWTLRFGRSVWLHFMACSANPIFLFKGMLSLIQIGSFLNPIFSFIPGGPSCWFAGARPSNFVSGVSLSPSLDLLDLPYVQFPPFCMPSRSPSQPPLIPKPLVGFSPSAFGFNVLPTISSCQN